MVREMRFHSAFNSNGTTGWTLSSNRLPSRAGPMSWSWLNWNGTLISAATGFESCRASSSGWSAEYTGRAAAQAARQAARRARPARGREGGSAAAIGSFWRIGGYLWERCHRAEAGAVAANRGDRRL
jgi:hypothetical protein